MKNLNNISYLVIASLIIMGGVTIKAQTPIDQWGLSAEYNTVWPILNDATTPAGDASMAGEVVSAWRGLQGGFGELSITGADAIVVKGKIQIVGAGAGTAYTPLRYALTYQDSNTTLVNALTDSATWSHQGNHFGYGFHPRTGSGTMSNGAGGSGTVWTIDNGNWASTWSNNGGPIAAVNQQPRNAEMIAGTYDFAISVISIDDTTNEVSWYMIEENNGYWFGGTAIDTATSKKFNSIIFGINDVDFTEFNIIGATVELGTPIVVPEAPWEAYYVDQWGLSAEYNTNWPILNDSTTLVGDASMAGEALSGWRGLQGGFGQDLEVTTEKALIVEGQIEIVGAGAGTAYTPLRYALTYQDSNSTLVNALTDSATWSHQGNHFGYGFHPRTGSGTMSNGAGGSGTVWTIDNGNWASTWSNNGGPIAAVNQQPRNAEMIAGTYDFAISVISIDDTTNEVSWYMIEENNGYWFGGTAIDTATSKKFNSIIFGINDVDFTEFNVIAMQVDKGDPIVVPEAPWEAYYVDQWGLSAEYNTNWPILNDSTTLVGDASMAGEALSGWRGLQGGFGQDLEVTTEKALIVEGQIEIVGAGAGTAYTPLRYALTYQDSNSTLVNALTDSATWSHQGNHFGYGFHPRTGSGTMSNGAGGSGTVWTIDNGNWASTWSNNGGPIAAVNQQPRNAEMIAGTYDFAISVISIDDTTNEVSWYMIEENNGYWFGGTAIDTATSKKFNSIIFGINDVDFTEFNVIAMQVDKGDPIVVPEAPWEAYYVDQWGLSAEYNTNWPILNDSTTLVGDASMAGEALSGWRGLQGGFGQDLEVTTEKALIVEGQIEIVGAGAGTAYTPLRYALTYQDSNSTLVNALTDSATWSHQGNHFGYGFHPRTGSGTMSNGAGGSGTVWTIDNGNWASTWSNNGGPIAAVNQQPRNAEMIAGTYDFAISVISIDDITNQISWYMIEENNGYWFGGTVIDTATSKKFNSIIFGINDVDFTEFNVIAMQVDKGDPIEIPKAPWEDFYVDTWGIYGGNHGGWSLKPGEFTGNVDFIGSAAPVGSAVVRGELGTINPEADVDVFVLEGNIILDNGGFEGSASLQFGLFNGDAGSIAVDSTLDSSNVWTGTDDNNSGYLLIPQEGTNGSVPWGTGTGFWGKITDGVWSDYASGLALGDLAPLQTTGGAGSYKFEICVAPKSDGTSHIIWTLKKSDGSYYMEGFSIDNEPVASFNSLVVGITDGGTATSMHLSDVQATITDKIIETDVDEISSVIPTSYELGQNYPNPFNPSTTIEFALPKNSNVKLVVYDILGSEVTTLINNQFNAGYHKVNFSAANLASGIYFYTLKAGDFVSTKKLVLLK